MSSQTAHEYIATQLSLEADAREALPYQFDNCTYPLGPLRQSVYACLTCSPPPAASQPTGPPAGVCYSCSISCHGEHTLIEIFTKRNFVCDCGTSRFASGTAPCNLRPGPNGVRGGVTGAEPRGNNKYNHNFQGRFCSCGKEYDPDTEKGTMFQCLGLGTVEDGGCGEDWWHPECLMGMQSSRTEDHERIHIAPDTATPPANDSARLAVPGQANVVDDEMQSHRDDPPVGFPREDDFDHLICYKCTTAFPWIKQYAGTPGFLPALAADEPAPDGSQNRGSKKRLADDASPSHGEKRPKLGFASPTLPVHPETSAPSQAASVASTPAPKHAQLPPPPSGRITVFVTEDFRDHICRCAECFPRLAKHPQLLEEEEAYEPPLSESDGRREDGSIAGHSLQSGSLLDRGEAALSSMDRVKAIEGVIAYNYVRDRVKAFLQPFAESGQPVSAEDIKAYFARLRGDEQVTQAASSSDGTVHGDGRKEDGC